MPAANAPGFLQDIHDEDRKSSLEYLADPFSEPKPETPAPEKPADAPKVEDKKEEPKPPIEGKPEEKKPEEKKEEVVITDKKEEPKAPVKQEEPKKEEPKKEEQVPEKPKEKFKFAGKEFASIEEAEKSYNSMVGMYSRVAADLKKDGTVVQGDEDFKKNLEYLKNTPLVDYELPKHSDYVKDGAIDLDKYMADSMKSFMLGLQRSLLGGQLASTQFSLLARATEEHYNETMSKTKRQAEASTTLTKLTEEFPILNKDETVQDLYERAIIGERVKREQKARAEGKKPEPLTYDDLSGLLKNILRVMKVEEKPVTPDPVETPKGPGPVIDTGAPQISDEERKVNEMIASKKGKLF